MIEEMQSIPFETVNLLMKFADMMSEIINAERFYETNLRDISNEIGTLYFKMMKDMMQGKSVEHRNYQLQLLEFRLHEKICDGIIDKSSRLAKNLDRIWFADTSELNVAMETARQQKSLAKNDIDKEDKIVGCIDAIKGTVSNTYKVYSDFKAKKTNLERKAKIKWFGALGGAFGLFATIYYPILSSLQKLDNPNLVIGIPSFVVVVLFVIYVYIFGQEEESETT
jgi:hypothetical protein